MEKLIQYAIIDPILTQHQVEAFSNQGSCWATLFPLGRGMDRGDGSKAKNGIVFVL